MEALIKTNVIPEHVKKGIEEWMNLIKNKDVKTIHKLLNQGKLVINRREYDFLIKELSCISDLKSESEIRVNYYFGIENGQFVAYIIDSYSDNNKDFSRIITKPFKLGVDLSDLKEVKIDVDPEMSKEEFLERVYNWNLFSYNWIEDRLNGEKENGMFEGISNPISDLAIPFSEDKVKTVYHTLGLYYIGKSKKSNNSNDCDLQTVVYDDLVNYKLDYFCSYICKEDRGKEQYLEVSWPTFSNKEYNTDKEKYKYNLFGE